MNETIELFKMPVSFSFGTTAYCLDKINLTKKENTFRAQELFKYFCKDKV